MLTVIDAEDVKLTPTLTLRILPSTCCAKTLIVQHVSCHSDQRIGFLVLGSGGLGGGGGGGGTGLPLCCEISPAAVSTGR